MAHGVRMGQEEESLREYEGLPGKEVSTGLQSGRVGTEQRTEGRDLGPGGLHNQQGVTLVSLSLLCFIVCSTGMVRYL